MERLYDERDGEENSNVDVPAVVTSWHEIDSGSTSGPGCTPRDWGEDKHRRDHSPQEKDSRLQRCLNSHSSGTSRESQHPKGHGSPRCTSVDVAKPREQQAHDHGHPGPPAHGCRRKGSCRFGHGCLLIGASTSSVWPPGSGVRGGPENPLFPSCPLSEGGGVSGRVGDTSLPRHSNLCVLIVQASGEISVHVPVHVHRFSPTPGMCSSSRGI